LPMNRNKPPLAAFWAALVNWSVDITDNPCATSRNSDQTRVAEAYYYSLLSRVGYQALSRRLRRLAYQCASWASCLCLAVLASGSIDVKFA
jgi:hypothetical protein